MKYLPPEETSNSDSTLSAICRWLEVYGDQIPEPERARIHALTRKVTLSDADLQDFWQTGVLDALGPEMNLDALNQKAVQLLRDLRDRYEERGKFSVLPTVRGENHDA